MCVHCTWIAFFFFCFFLQKIVVRWISSEQNATLVCKSYCKLEERGSARGSGHYFHLGCLVCLMKRQSLVAVQQIDKYEKEGPLLPGSVATVVMLGVRFVTSLASQRVDLIPLISIDFSHLRGRLFRTWKRGPWMQG